MRKYIFTLLLLLSGFFSTAQVYYNEWIDYSKTYYKFKIGRNGLYRINQSSLAAIGLATTPAEHFQLWKNGQEVALFTSVSSGTLGNTDFLEFYGEMNNGVPDKQLYKYDSLQMCDHWSILTDTAAYFLTVNVTGTNKRIVNTANDVAGNSLPADSFFMHTLAKYYKVGQNPGYGIDFGEIVHSSAFDKGEGWIGGDIYVAPYGTGYMPDNNSNLYLFGNGPAASLTAVVAGNYTSSRNISIKVNGTSIASSNNVGYDITRFSNVPVPLNTFAGDIANLEFWQDGAGVDHIVVSHFELTYPRSYNFGGQSSFNFEIPAGPAKYLEILNFNFGSLPPILVDRSNNLRLTAIVSGDTLKFVLPVSAINRQLVLLNVEPANINSVTDFTTRNFVDYSQVAQQGNYVIISHPLLFNDGNGQDNVEKYRQYRSSLAGGGFNAKTVNIDQLTDQFAFGIKHHPLAIRNFASYALTHFATAPSYFFLIGKGLNYMAFRSSEADPNVNKLALVPTFGWPPSDNLLTATRTGNTTRIPIGRLSAINGTEVGDFLDKMKQYELAQTSSPQTVNGKGWMKNVAQITGAIDDLSLYYLISSFMDGYQQTLIDTSMGAKVYNFSKNSGQYTAIGSNKTIDNLFSEGMSMLTYFGHSSPNTLEFNLDNPQNYNNTGKYPLIVVNGCNSGNLFLFDTLRPINKGTLSEKYIFTPQKGSIGFIADTHFGLPQQLNYFNSIFANNIAGPMYGNTLGKIMKSTMETLTTEYDYDFIAKCHAEEMTFHGDPATRINNHLLPDYTITDSLIDIQPTIISVADDKVKINAKILNIGKAINDSITIRFEHRLPDSSVVLLANRRIKATFNEDTLQVILNLNPLKHKGQNSITITIDPEHALTELSELNNTITKSFTVLADEIRPVYPFNYSIINSSNNFAVFGSTANPLAEPKDYVMELDTTRLFNSPFKVQKTVNSIGGVIKFLPEILLVDSTVYYWRLTTGTPSDSSRWLNSSFVYINGSYEGYNQSHYFQFKDNLYNTITLDSASRKFNFDDKTRKLLIRTGLYPYYDWDQINVNVDNDQVEGYGCKYKSLQIVVYDPLTLKPWVNYNTGSGGRFGSWPPDCAAPSAPTRKFFEFPYYDSVYRRRAMQFFDSIPAGYFVSITNLGWTTNNVFIDQWKADTINLGAGNSLWHKFHSMGLHQIDGFTSNLPFVFVFRKGDTTDFQPRQHVGASDNYHIVDTFNILGKNIAGSVESPWIGPAKAWQRFKWNLTPDNNPNSTHSFDIIGKDLVNNDILLSTVRDLQDSSIAGISATIHPYLKVRINTTDPVNAKAAQLKYWMLTADEYPEGALAPNMFFEGKDTIVNTDTLHFKIAFKNISKIAFDSIKLRLTITKNNGTQVVFNNLPDGSRLKPLVSGDSVIIVYDLPMQGYEGHNQLKLDVNPDSAQAEQFHFNNIMYSNLYVILPVCPGGNTSFTSSSITSGDTYQWQVDTGAGYSNISNSALYSGVATSTLNIIAAPTSMYGYHYRCLVTNNGLTASSNDFVLKFGLTWTGAVSDAWELPANWSCTKVPDSNTDVIVNGGAPNNPILSTNVICRSITANSGAVITVNPGFQLILSGKH